MEHLSLEVVNRLVELGKNSAGPQFANGANVPYVMVTDKDGATTPKLMPELIFNDQQKPLLQIKQSVTVEDPDSFANYYRLYSDANSLVFADEAKVSVGAILDFHVAALDGAKQEARHGSHRVTLALRHTPSWLVWAAANNKKFAQQEFAEFLEQNIYDVVTPSPATMMEVARDLQATNEVNFGSAIRQNDGQVRFRYSEEVKATVGAGQLAIPEEFEVGFPVFVGGESIRLRALFRFRVNGGKLQLWYTLIRPHEAIRAAFVSARHQIEDALKITIINGSPTAS